MENPAYILFSSSSEKYYCGYTSITLEQRLRRHKSNHRGFTGNVSDWEIVFSTSFDTKEAAMSLERTIKKRGMKRYLEFNQD